MNRNIIKYIAVVAMVIDHIGALFVPISTPLGTAMRVIGRLTAPIMCYFLCEGYLHTRNKKRYAIRLLIFGVLSQFAYTYMLYGYFWKLHFNVIVTFFLCFMLLLVLDKAGQLWLKALLVATIMLLCHYCDWGLMAPLWTACFYICKDSKRNMSFWYLILCAFWVCRCCYVTYSGGGEWYNSLWQIGSVLALPIILSYNGKKGSDNKFSKWFFYWFYPLHMLILGIMFRT